MKIICKQENLISGLLKVSHLTGKNFNLPILNNILIKADSGIIELSATNLEMGVKTSIRGRIEQEGKVTIPAKIITDYINLINGDKNIILETQEGEMLINSDGWQTKIKTNPAEDYPLTPEVKSQKKYHIKTTDFKDGLNSVIFAASYNETKPELTGILFWFKEKNLILAATNSYRLAERKIEIEQEVKTEEKIIIPLKSMQEMVRIINDTTKEYFTLDFEENQIKFDFEETIIVSRLIDGEYPDYQQIIPHEFGIEIEVDNTELVKAIKAASLFTKSGIFDVTLEFTKDVVIVRSINSQLGENVIKINISHKGGDETVIFNYKFLLDGLNNINSLKTRILINSPINPIVFKSTTNNDFMYLVMPIRQ